MNRKTELLKQMIKEEVKRQLMTESRFVAFYMGKKIEIEDRVKLEPPASVHLKSQYPGTVIVIGSATGQRYVFNKAGVELEVDANDAPKMLEKVFGGNSCCGSGAKPISHFVVV